MNIVTIIGIILIALGVVGLVYGGVTYTSSSNAINMGPMHMEVDQQRHVPLSPIAGVLSIAVGVVLIIVGRRRTASAGAA